MTELKFDMIKDLLFGLTLLDEKKEDAIMQIKEIDGSAETRSKSIRLAENERIFGMNVTTKGNAISIVDCLIVADI
jgi:hypothetical protein